MDGKAGWPIGLKRSVRGCGEWPIVYSVLLAVAEASAARAACDLSAQ